MNFLANILAGIATASASEGSPYSVWFIWDEPECPEEIL